MNRADAGAGQHRDGRFRHHWHIDSNHITFFDALGQQNVGKAADIAVQFAVGNMFALGCVVAFPDDGRLIAALGKMTIQAVGGEVQRAVFIPFNRDIAGGKGGVLDRLIRGDPVKNFALLAPEGVRVGNRQLILLLVLLRVDQAAVRNICGNVVFMDLAHGFCSPCRMLIICRKNVNCRGFGTFVYYLGDRSRKN